MEGFYNYHNFSSAYRPKSFSQNTGDGSAEGNGGGVLTVGDLLGALLEGGGGSGPGPKSSTGIQLGQILSNFFARLFATAKRDAKISKVLPGAAVSYRVETGAMEGSFETALKWEEVLSVLGIIARGGQWAIPLMLNGDSSHARGYNNWCASRRGNGGVILKQSFPVWRLSNFNNYPGEQEMQVFGPVYGAQVIKPWGKPGTWSPYIG